MRDYRSSKSADQSTDKQRSSLDDEEGYDREAVQARSLRLINREVQRLAAGSAAAKDEGAVQETAAAGVAGTGTEMPHRDQIQASFGPHDVSHVRAHVGGDAAQAAGAIGAKAYATGNDVAFADAPDLHTAAHEAAHVVQQRQGVHLKGGVGQQGDAYEQQADAVADAVVAGKSAAPVLGPQHATNASAAIQMIPMPAAGIRAADEAHKRSEAIEERERAERREAEPESTKRQRLFLISNVRDQMASIFGALREGSENAYERMKSGTSPMKKTDALEALISTAAKAAIAGGIGATASLFGKLLTGGDLKGLAEKGVTDALKDALKGSLSIGAEHKGTTDGELLLSFNELQKAKLRHAESAFLETFWTDSAESLYGLEIDDLEALSRERTRWAQTDAYAEQQARSFSVEWVNFLSRKHHGEMLYDPWEGEDGRPGRALETAHTRKGSEAALGNVDPTGINNILDDEQRKMQESHHGLLEIHLWLDADGISVYTRDAKRGMRMDNVAAYAREQLAKMGTVGAAHVNKIVRVYQSLGSEEINPRPPAANIFVSADGYIRNWSTGMSNTKFLGESRIEELVEFAEGLSIAGLE